MLDYRPWAPGKDLSFSKALIIRVRQIRVNSELRRRAFFPPLIINLNSEKGRPAHAGRPQEFGASPHHRGRADVGLKERAVARLAHSRGKSR